jgi:hypothetical protein
VGSEGDFKAQIARKIKEIRKKPRKIANPTTRRD